jgi:hypothetical protein
MTQKRWFFIGKIALQSENAGVAELADALDSKSVAMLGSDQLIATLLPD